ncbi:MFS transporter [Haloarcula marina]|uniref:MFS transporter n=1 Tax=Haloarcula marina TaxID=2961574 RepID=UPI0020B7540E|nr:MFS transporter [Halomicroarcula marina]
MSSGRLGTLVGAVSDATAVYRGRGRGTVLSLVALGWLLVLGTRLVVPAILPQIRTEFGITNATAGFAVTLIWLTYAIMQFPAGVLTDRVGERRLLLASLFVGSVSVLAFSVAPLFALFLGACVLFGAGTGLYGPPRVTILSRTYPDNDGGAIGLTFAAGNVGSAVLPLVVGWVSVAYGWRTGLRVLFPLFVLVFVGMWFYLRAAQTEPLGRPDDSFWRALRRVAASINDSSVLVLGSATTVTLFVFQGFTAFFPTYLVAVKELPQATAATLFGAFFVTGIVVQPLSGGAADRFGYRRLLLGLTSFTVLMLAVLPFVQGFWPLAALSVLLGVRSGIDPINNAFLVAMLPDDVQGSSFGLLRSLYLGFGAVGSYVVGLFADADRFDEAFLFLAALTAVSFGLYLLLPRKAAE